MESLYAVRLQLAPTPAQEEQFYQLAGCKRVVFNCAREQRRWFARPGKGISFSQQCTELAEFKEQFPWLADAPHHVLQQALADLEAAYKNFWAGRAGPPQAKKKGRGDSFRFPDPTQIELVGNLQVPDKRRTHSIKRAWLKLPKVGRVACALHRAIPKGAKLCSVTISLSGGRWSASVLLSVQVPTPEDRRDAPVVGIDMGVKQPVALSTGGIFQLPRASDGDAEHLAKLHQAIARKKKGSRNRKKAKTRLAAFQACQARVRKDAMEKVTTAIAKNHAVVAMEDLRIKNMTASARGTVEEPGKNVTQKAGLNRSFLDVAPGRFRERLGHKLAASGGMLLLVPAHYTSQRCSRCGHISAENRKTRDWFACVKCKHEQDADINAAENIRQLARGEWGNPDKVEVANSLELLLAQLAKPRRRFKKAKKAGGLPASACLPRGGFFHGQNQSRKRVAATQPSAVPEKGAVREAPAF